MTRQAHEYTLAQYIQAVHHHQKNPADILEYYIQQAEHHDDVQAYVRIEKEYVQEHAQKFQTKPLAGAPIAIKDIIMVKDTISSCGSAMLESYVSPYTATCVANLERHGGLMIAKANMDEFAMGSSGEYSAFHQTYNPHGTQRSPGGSSGGSAAAVAANLCVAALGTDTGGSVRQPAARCGIVGMKPTYGRVSRYGVQSMASSLDQVGVLTKTVHDAQILLQAIAGYDPHDAQSQKKDEDMLTWAEQLQENNNLKGLRIALPQEWFTTGLDEGIENRIMSVVDKLREAGVLIERVSLPSFEHAVSVYYALMPAELSTNLARFDGIRYGLQKDTHSYKSIHEYYQAVRTEGFGEEAQRRILLGTYLLSAEHYHTTYAHAVAIRRAMQSELNDLWKKYDLVLGPTTPTVARKLDGSQTPLQAYMADMYTIPANITGCPALSVPVGTLSHQGEDMPVGCQLMAPRWKEGDIRGPAAYIENLFIHTT